MAASSLGLKMAVLFKLKLLDEISAKGASTPLLPKTFFLKNCFMFALSAFSCMFLVTVRNTSILNSSSKFLDAYWMISCGIVPAPKAVSLYLTP
jgi:hypothetical protein